MGVHFTLVLHQCILFYYLFTYLLMAALHGLRNLSSLTRDRTPGPHNESAKS